MTIRTLSVGALATNCYIVIEGGTAAVIDPGDNAAAITKAIAESGAVLGAVLLTHAHFDHMGALAELTANGDIPVYLHTLEQPALHDGTRNLSALFGAPLSPVTAAVRPLSDGDTVAVGPLSFTVVHTPGHTPGSVCYLSEDVLFSGDTLFAQSIGRTDFPGGDLSAMRASLTRIMTLSATRVLPGHGEETTLAFEQRYNPYIAR